MEQSETFPSVAILGGSFDPIHLGHLAMAEAVQRKVGIDRILFLPCYVSPHKSGTVATSQQRLDMLEIALGDQSSSGGEISRFEIEREGPSYSWETISAFFKKQPEIKWHWIVGTDQWNSLERWARPDVLREKLHFVVCTRGDDQLVGRSDWRSTVVPFEHPASSTAIRKDFDAHTDWLTPGVVRYCRENGIYS